MAAETPDLASAPARLYKPVLTPKLRNGDVYLVYATMDNKETISLRFDSEEERREWLREAATQAGI